VSAWMGLVACATGVQNSGKAAVAPPATLASPPPAPTPAPAARAPATGLLVVAADRGFLGDTELTDAAASLPGDPAVERVFTTDERTRESLTKGLQALAARGVKHVRVAPFFLSRRDPGYALLETLLARDAARGTTALVPGLTVDVARPFGESYLAVEVLAER